MGCYVNPPSMSKECWLFKHGKPVNESETVLTETHVPVCLVDNGAFQAAGVAFSERERQAFTRPDGRRKSWYMVAREDLYKVSDLQNWEKEL